MSTVMDSTLGRSPEAKPNQSVAQNIMLCSLLKRRSWSWLISPWSPSRPWPYSDGRAGFRSAAVALANGLPDNVVFAMRQVKVVVSSPLRSGRPSP